MMINLGPDLTSLLATSHSAAAHAIAQLRQQITSDVIAAWLEGKDFAHGPPQFETEDPFSTSSIFAPRKSSVVVRGGAITAGSADCLPAGWTVYPVADRTEGELARLRDGRHDWREGDWQDHCGIPGCEQCDKEPTVI